MENIPTQPYKRKHRPRSRAFFLSKTHPETLARIEQKELTPERMVLANERRQILAYYKIHNRLKVLRDIRKREGRKGQLSLRAIAKHTRSCRNTVKGALRLTYAQIILRLVGAFSNTSSRSLDNIKILGAGPGWAWNIMGRVCELGARILRVDIQDIAKNIRPVSRAERRKLDELYARQYQAEKQHEQYRDMAMPEKIGVLSVRLTGETKKAFLNRHQNKGAWIYRKSALAAQFHQITKKVCAKIREITPPTDLQRLGLVPIAAHPSRRMSDEEAARKGLLLMRRVLAKQQRKNYAD